jgi:UDP-2,3-diacylglucosamine hydrolase
MVFQQIPDIQLQKGKKIYFLSDFHLGIPNEEISKSRERKVVSFLRYAAKDAAAVFIQGDLFDFWFEYRRVVPKGYVRILGQLAEMSDQGIALHFFAGNHDMWMRDYFLKEFSMPVYYEPRKMICNGKHFLLGHGDGLGPGDRGYKFLKVIFRNPVCKWLFGILPSVAGIGIADYFSKRSRHATGIKDDVFMGEDKEWLVTYCRGVLKHEKVDYFIFGHRHLPIDFTLNEESRYINLGDWIRYDTYAEFDGELLQLKTFQP